MKQVKQRGKTITNNWVAPKKLLLVYLFFLFVLIAVLGYISLSDKVLGNDLKQISENRTMVSKELIANRGNIYDVNSNLLATNVTSYTLIAYLDSSRTIDNNDPKHVVDKEMTAKKLAEVLKAPEDYILERLNKDSYQVEFGSYGSKLTELTKIAIDELELPGISFVESTKRFYPNGEFSSYIIGYAKEYTQINIKLKETFDLKTIYKNYYNVHDNIKLTVGDDNYVVNNGDSIKGIKVGTTTFKLTIGNTDKILANGIINITKEDVSTRTDIVTVGELGVESKYNNILKGINGKITYQRDKSGLKIPDTPETKVEAIDGKDIYLTIDSSIQRFLETAVKKEVAAWKPEWMIMVAMDAKTGEILGSATSPSYDPNNLSSTMSYQNPLVSYAYEPGSVMKIYDYLCAINTGKYNGSKKYRSGSIKIGPDTVHDWYKSGWGMITYDVGFTYSSNVGAINVARDYLSPSKLKACLQSFGFGSKTDIELSNELPGNINFNETVELDWLTASYGQGISTTAIQQVQALSILANDGHMVKPHIIKKIVDNKTGEVTETKIQVSDKLVSTQAVNYVKKLMYDNVHNKGATGQWYYIKGFNIIGKTGTGQIYEKGHYLEGNSNYLISFAGMFPYNDPEIIIYTAIKKPRTYFNQAISPYVKEVIANIAKYRNMYSEIEEKNSSLEQFTLNNYVSTMSVSAKNELDKKKMNTVIIGAGDKIVNQYPIAGTKVVTGDRVFLVTNDKTIKMPNMLGWSRSDITTFCNLANQEYKITGYGYVTTQNIKVGTILDGSQAIEVTLANKEVKKAVTTTKKKA